MVCSYLEGDAEHVSCVFIVHLSPHLPILSHISIVAGVPGAVKTFATTGVDGHLVVWDSKVRNGSVMADLNCDCSTVLSGCWLR